MEGKPAHIAQMGLEMCQRDLADIIPDQRNCGESPVDIQTLILERSKPMPWTNDISLFKQTMFNFDENDLAKADKLAIEIAKKQVQEKNSPATALATFVILLADFIAANVDQDRWDEGLTAIGLLTNAALARLGLEHGPLKMGSRHVQ